MTNNKNNTENRYGNLLKNVMENKEDRGYSERIFVYEKKTQDEGNDRYGNLLDSIERVEDRLYNTVSRIGDTNRAYRNKQAKDYEESLRRMEERREQKAMEEKERMEANCRLINEMENKRQQKLSDKAKKYEAEKRERESRIQSVRAMENLNWTPKKIW